MPKVGNKTSSEEICVLCHEEFENCECHHSL